MLTQLSQDDVDKLTQQYLQEKQPDVTRQTMIDALGTAHTSNCYTVMMRRVFLVNVPDAELLMRALFQLIHLSTPAPEVTLGYHVYYNIFWLLNLCNNTNEHGVILKLHRARH